MYCDLCAPSIYKITPYSCLKWLISLLGNIYISAQNQGRKAKVTVPLLVDWHTDKRALILQHVFSLSWQAPKQNA
jgi:hypothetical protein